MQDRARGSEASEALSPPVYDKLFQDEPAPSYMAELCSLISLAAPACVQLLATMLIITANQALVGHIGPKELAAASIACTVCKYGSCLPD